MNRREDEADRRTVSVTRRSVLTAGGLMVTLAACGDEGSEDADAGGKVTISVGDQPAETAESEYEAYHAAIEAFMEENPNITVEASDARWEATTFQAMLAGGTMPTVMKVAFTETRSLIANGQVADVTAAAESTGVLDQLDPAILDWVQDGEGSTYGIPISTGAISLIYNRDLFEQAGLDPDVPPSTWDELKSAAKQISDTTDAAGYVQLTEAEQGGWINTAQVYSYGGLVENEEGTKTLYDSAETIAALEDLHEMYFEDGSMGSTVLWNVDSMLQEFAAGKVGMTIVSVEAYEWINSTYDMDLAMIGAAGVPQVDADEPSGTLFSGSAEIFSPDATEAELEAAVKWVQFRDLQKYTNKEQAVEDAKTKDEGGQIVGLPSLLPLSEASTEEYRSWIEPYANVDLSHFTAYTESLSELPLIAEPRTKAQEVYAELGTLMQSVLSDENANIEDLVADTSERIDAIIQ